MPTHGIFAETVAHQPIQAVESLPLLCCSTKAQICAVHCYVELPSEDRRISLLWRLWTAHNVGYCLERSIASNLSGGRNWPRRTLGGTNDAIVSNFSEGSARR